MTVQDIITLICGIGWVGTFVMFLVQRHDAKKDKNSGVNEQLKDIDKRLKKQEKDNVRIQLLLLMASYTPEDERELLTCAEHYFSKEHLNANWYMTSKFNRFIEQQNIAKPSWFEGD